MTAAAEDVLFRRGGRRRKAVVAGALLATAIALAALAYEMVVVDRFLPTDGNVVAVTTRRERKEGGRRPQQLWTHRRRQQPPPIENTTTTTTTTELAAVAAATRIDHDDDDDDDDGGEEKTETTTTIERRTRPWMVVHVGPPKTGTTTLQNGLRALAADLAGSDDNVFYLGSAHSRMPKTVRYGHGDDDDEDEDGSSSFRVYPVRCFSYGGRVKSDVTADIELHRSAGRNVVLSSEHFTSKALGGGDPGSYLPRVFDGLFLRGGYERDHRAGWCGDAPADGDDDDDGIEDDDDDDDDTEEGYEDGEGDETPPPPTTNNSTDDDVDESSTFGFDVRVVVTYRHYFQWLPSFYYQRELLRMSPEEPPGRIEYIENVLDELGDEYTTTTTTTPADDDDEEDSLLRDWPATDVERVPSSLSELHGSLYPYLRWSSPASLRHRVEVFDMHRQRLANVDGDTDVDADIAPDLLRDFVCGVLPDATRTCAALRDDEAASASSASAKASSTTTTMERARIKHEGNATAFETGELSDTEFLRIKRAALARLDPSAPSVFRNSASGGEPARNVRAFVDESFAAWVAAKNEEAKARAGVEDEPPPPFPPPPVCLGEASLRRLRTASWNLLRHLEALARTTRRRRTKRPGEEEDEEDRPAAGGGLLLLSPPVGDDSDDDDERATKTKMKAKWGPIKAAHDELFEATVESGAYCQLDLDRLFADETFAEGVLRRVPPLPTTTTTTKRKKKKSKKKEKRRRRKEGRRR